MENKVSTLFLYSLSNHVMRSIQYHFILCKWRLLRSWKRTIDPAQSSSAHTALFEQQEKKIKLSLDDDEDKWQKCERHINNWNYNKTIMHETYVCTPFFIFCFSSVKLHLGWLFLLLWNIKEGDFSLDSPLGKVYCKKIGMKARKRRLMMGFRILSRG